MRGHLHGVERIAGRGVQARQNRSPGRVEAGVVLEFAVLVEQPFDIGLLAVLQDIVGAVGEFVGVAETPPSPAR